MFGDKYSNMAEYENKKTAVEIGVNLSMNIIAATLALIAILGGLSTFLIDTKEPNLLLLIAFLLILFSFSAFVVSIYHGAKGIDKARKSIFYGVLSMAVSKNNFNKQTIWCFVGILTFVIVLLMCLGNDKQDGSEVQLKLLNEKVQYLISNQEFDNTSKEKIIQLEERIKAMEKLIDSTITITPQEDL